MFNPKRIVHQKKKEKKEKENVVIFSPLCLYLFKADVHGTQRLQFSTSFSLREVKVAAKHLHFVHFLDVFIQNDLH